MGNASKKCWTRQSSICGGGFHNPPPQIKEIMHKWGIMVLKKVLDKVTSGFAVVSALLIMLMMLGIVYDVIMRNMLQPTVWAQPISEIILVYSTFLAVAWVLGKDGHVKFTLVMDHLKSYKKALLNTIVSVIGTVLCFILLWQSSYRLFNSIREGYTPVTAFAVPEWTTYVAIPVGCLLLSIQYLRKILDSIGILKAINNSRTTKKLDGETN
jgi:TRAP-type C4-dicarboxylate transport system permease small subunit